MLLLQLYCYIQHLPENGSGIYFLKFLFYMLTTRIRKGQRNINIFKWLLLSLKVITLTVFAVIVTKQTFTWHLNITY